MCSRWSTLHFLLNAYDSTICPTKVTHGLPACATLVHVPGMKGNFWNRLLTPANTSLYEYIWLFDSDMVIDEFPLGIALDGMRQADTSAAQPLVFNARGGRATDYAHLRASNGLEGGCRVQETTLMEVMTPIFKQDAWAYLHTHLLQQIEAEFWVHTIWKTDCLWCKMLKAGFPGRSAGCAVLSTAIDTLDTHAIENHGQGVERGRMLYYKEELYDKFQHQYGVCQDWELGGAHIPWGSLGECLLSLPYANMGRDCWDSCAGHANSQCNWCGSGGACCRQGQGPSTSDCAFETKGCHTFHCCVHTALPPPVLPPPPPTSPALPPPSPCAPSSPGLPPPSPPSSPALPPPTPPSNSRLSQLSRARARALSRDFVATLIVLVVYALVHSLCLRWRTRTRATDAALAANGNPEQVTEIDSSGAQESSPRSPLLTKSEHLYQWTSLTVLVVQASSAVLVRRHTSIRHADKYATTAVLLCIELVKLVLASLLYAIELKAGPKHVAAAVWAQRREMIPLSAPAICYVIQQNLLFVAAALLSAPALQTIMQLKIVFTAIFARIVLKKQISLLQCESLAILLSGVVVVGQSDEKAQAANGAAGVGGHLFGLCAAFGSAVISALAGILLEKLYIMKMSLWARNVQLSLLSVPLQALMMAEFDRSSVVEHGVFHGFHEDTVLLIFIQAGGGLLVAVVIKYAGNIAKNFANGLSLVLTSFFAMILFGLRPSTSFWMGVLGVCIAPILYSLSPMLYGRSLSVRGREEARGLRRIAECATSNESSAEGGSSAPLPLPMPNGTELAPVANEASSPGRTCRQPQWRSVARTNSRSDRQFVRLGQGSTQY